MKKIIINALAAVLALVLFVGTAMALLVVGVNAEESINRVEVAEVVSMNAEDNSVEVMTADGNVWCVYVMDATEYTITDICAVSLNNNGTAYVEDDTVTDISGAWRP